MTRIYIENPSLPLTVSDTQQHYLKTVLRKQSGDSIEILTAEILFTGSIEFADKKSLNITVTEKRQLTPPPYKITVFQCLLKREYMDTVIEKYTELGITDIVPVISAHSLPALKENTERRFKEIAIAAALQSEQDFIPRIAPAIRLRDIEAKAEHNLLFYERGDEAPLTLSDANNVSLVIGPEGGFTGNEVQILIQKGFTAVRPLASILKAETAAVVFGGYVRLMMRK